MELKKDDMKCQMKKETEEAASITTLQNKNREQSRRPLIAMDYDLIKMKSVPNAQTISEESITCIAVKEDRHQIIMSIVAMKKGVEEPWTIEKFIDLFGYREIMLKRDTEPAIISSSNRVAKMCKAEVPTKDAAKGDKRVDWAHRERGDVAAWNHPNHQVSHPEQHARTTQ